jgi:hypothetical protein
MRSFRVIGLVDAVSSVAGDGGAVATFLWERSRRWGTVIEPVKTAGRV